MRHEISVSYDPAGDVLYLLQGAPGDTRNVEEEPGLVLRYDGKTKAPIGATILDYKEYWLPRRSELVSHLARFLHISRAEVQKALAKDENYTDEEAERRTAEARKCFLNNKLKGDLHG